MRAFLSRQQPREKTDLYVEIHLDGTILDTRADCERALAKLSSGSCDMISLSLYVLVDRDRKYTVSITPC